MECFILIIVNVFYHCLKVEALYRNQSGLLNTFPTDIPSSEQDVVLNNNNIAAVDSSEIQHLNNVKRFYMISNKLTEFLDIRPMASSLEFINLAHNSIQTLNPDYFQGVSKLYYVELSNNQLTVFPDMGDGKNTITHLILKNNPLSSVPPGSFLGFAVLHNLNILPNEFETIPNTCRPDMWTSMTFFSGTAKKLNCDCKIQHMHINPYSTFKFWPCVTPATLQGQSINSGLTPSQLVCDGLEGSNKKFVSFTKVKSDFYCGFPYVAKRYQLPTTSQCANACIETEGCFYFNVYSTNGSDDIICDLTSVHASAHSDVNVTNHNGWSYYSII